MKKINLILFGVILFSFISLSSISALSLVVHVPEKYAEVNAGERIYFEIEVNYPENPTRKDLRLEYEIKNLEGKLIAQSKILKSIETQISFIDFLVLPEGTSSGLYVLNVKVDDYEDLSEEVGTSFRVVGGKEIQMRIYFFVLLGSILFLGILVVVDILREKKIYKRKRS